MLLWLLMFIMLCFSSVSNQKLRKFLEKIRTVLKEIDPQLLRFRLSTESSKEYARKISRPHYFSKFLQIIWFHTQRKDGANNNSIWSPEINCYSSNYALQNTKAMVPSPDSDTNFFTHCCMSFTRRYINAIFVYNLTWLWTSIYLIKKWLNTQKRKKQMISCRNYNRRRLHRWLSASIKCTCPSRIPTTKSGASSKRNWPPWERK